MKKALLLAVLMLVALGSNAQTEKGRLTIQPRVGMTLASFTGGGMKILLLADIEDTALWDYFSPDRVKGYDLILAAGDLKAEYLTFLVTMSNLPVFYVHGNHNAAYDHDPPEGCECIDDRLVTYRGLRILGLGGSALYSREPYQYTEREKIDGTVHLEKKLKRGNREIVVTSKTGDQKRYLVPTSKQILAQENDYVKAGQPLSDGAITPASILAIMGPMKVQEYIVNEVQSVYRSQGVTINDKHFEVIVRQMMRKVEIMEPGDTRFLEGELVSKLAFQEENDNIYGKMVVTDAGDSEELSKGQIISAMKLRDENSMLKRKDLKLVETRPAEPATASQVLQGITRAALQTDSFMSAASFQETTKVLTNAAISAKTDYLLGMKENVIVGHKIPAGTGLREYDDLIVASREEYEKLKAQGAVMAE